MVFPTKVSPFSLRTIRYVWKLAAKLATRVGDGWKEAGSSEATNPGPSCSSMRFPFKRYEPCVKGFLVAGSRELSVRMAQATDGWPQPGLVVKTLTWVQI